MKLTTFILIVSMMQVSAKGFAQQLTLRQNNITLEKVFLEIKKQTGYDVFFENTKIKTSTRINVNFSNATLETVMRKIIGTNSLTFTISDKTIVVGDKVPSFINVITERVSNLFRPAITVTGKVINKKSELLSGTQIVIKRTGRGYTTDAKGAFSIKDLEENDSLVFSYIGYKTKTVAVNGKFLLTIVMEEATSDLDEIKVMGYGTTTQRLTTGNITSLKSDEITRQPVMNPLLALQGRVPGLEITSGGYAAGPVQIEIRGRQSINNDKVSADPLYIIDGVPLTVLEVGSYLGSGFDATNISPAQGQSPLFSLNAADIESIDVLKDADATAIYGSRGANGVILITTKRGKPGTSKIDLNASQGVNIVSGRWDMLNTEQYIAMRKEAFANDGKTPTPATAGDIFNNINQETDWQDYLWGGAGQWTNLQASLSGGSQSTTFRIAGGYNSTKDITVTNGDNLKANISLNIQNKSSNQKFSTNLALNYSYALINQVHQSTNVRAAPNAPRAYSSTGGPNFDEWRVFSNSFPFSNLFQPYENTTRFLTGNLELSYIVIKGLTAKANFGYNNNLANSTLSQPILSKYSPTNVKQTGNAFFSTTQVNNYIIEPQLSYTGQVGKGRLNLLLGGTYQDNVTAGNRTSGTGYTNDALLGSISLAPVVTAIENFAEYKYAGIFARASYNYENKYLLNINARRDGSSKFGPGKRFGNFGSLGLAWIASEEKFVKDLLPKAISFLKFRSSYGITGSDGVEDYNYLALYGNLSPQLADYNGILSLTPQLMSNENFHWQESKKFEAAADISFLNDRINLEAAYYSNRCDNQLINFPIPSYTGFTGVVANSPADVRNSGWEFTLSAKLVAKKDINYTMSFNIGMNKNILLNYPDLENSAYAHEYIIGQPLSIKFLYNFTGVDPLTGQYTFNDINGDGKISSNDNVVPGTKGDDRYIRVNTAPKFAGGFGHQFVYKNFSLNAYFTFKKQIGRNAFSTTTTGANNIALEQYLDRWQKPGDIAQYARLTTTLGDTDIKYAASTAAYSDASYIRLQNVALSWMLPNKWQRRWV